MRQSGQLLGLAGLGGGLELDQDIAHIQSAEHGGGARELVALGGKLVQRLLRSSGAGKPREQGVALLDQLRDETGKGGLAQV